jgi:hypothetical protein
MTVTVSRFARSAEVGLSNATLDKAVRPLPQIRDTRRIYYAPDVGIVGSETAVEPGSEDELAQCLTRFLGTVELRIQRQRLL